MRRNEEVKNKSASIGFIITMLLLTVGIATAMAASVTPTLISP